MKSDFDNKPFLMVLCTCIILTAIGFVVPKLEPIKVPEKKIETVTIAANSSILTNMDAIENAVMSLTADLESMTQDIKEANKNIVDATNQLTTINYAFLQWALENDLIEEAPNVKEK